MSTTRGRLVRNNELVRDQADFLQSDGFTRVTGLIVSSLQGVLFFNNASQPWTLVDGSAVTDAQATSGRVYWNEVPGTPGYYSVRFMPNIIGYWRLVIVYPGGTQIVAQDYDVTDSAHGASASFNKPGCV